MTGCELQLGSAGFWAELEFLANWVEMVSRVQGNEVKEQKEIDVGTPDTAGCYICYRNADFEKSFLTLWQGCGNK